MRIELVIEIENKRIGIRKDIKELPKLSAGLPAVENQLQLLQIFNAEEVVSFYLDGAINNQHDLAQISNEVVRNEF